MALTQVPIELSSTPGIVDNSNATAITIDSSENVGIGTSSPSTKLHLGGTAPGDSIIRQDSTASGTNWEIGERSAGKWQIFEDDSDSIVATFTSSGRLGLGTSSPNTTLELGGAGEAIRLSGSPTTAYIRSTDGTTNQWFIGSGGNAGLQHYIYQAQPMTFHTSGTERMRILSTGGITFNGDTTQANALDDYEEGTFTVTVNGTSGGNNTAYYTKVGNLVSWQYYTGAKTFTAVQAKITGLPFTTSNGSHNYASFFATHNNATTNAYSGYTSLNSNVSYFVTNDSISSPSYNTGTKYFMVSGHYFTD